MPSVGFEPTISAGEPPQTYALDRAATETGKYVKYHLQIYGSERYSILIMKSSTLRPYYLQRSVRAL